MKEKPILFSAPMVLALLEGRKTQTRRIVKPSIVQHIEFMGGNGEDPTEFDFVGLKYGQWRSDSGKEMPAEWLIYCTEYPEEGAIPIGHGYGAVGDRLWVREAWRAHDAFDHHPPRDIPAGQLLIFEADGDKETFPGTGKYRPPMFMPRWASRINLEIVGVRVERLQDISEADARAEGCITEEIISGYDNQPIQVPKEIPDESGKGMVGWENCRDWYADLWESLNGPDSWDANPWVWVIEFRKASSST